jgi:cytochrome c553
MSTIDKSGDTFSARECLARLKRIFPSNQPRLRAKSVVLVVGTVFLGTVLSFAFVLFLEFQQLIDRQRASAQRAGSVIEAALEYAMQTNDKTLLAQMLGVIVTEAEMGCIHILTPDGRIWLSSIPAENGNSFGPNAPVCRVCHSDGANGPRAPAVSNSQILDGVLLNVRTIPNQPACATCHGASARALGVLYFETPLDEVGDQLLWHLGKSR